MEIPLRIGVDGYPQEYLEKDSDESVFNRLGIFNFKDSEYDSKSITVTVQLYSALKERHPDYYFTCGYYGYDNGLGRRLIADIDNDHEKINLPSEKFRGEYYYIYKYNNYEVMQAIYCGVHCDNYLISAPKEFFIEKYWVHTTHRTSKKFKLFIDDLAKKINEIDPEKIYASQDGFLWQSGYSGGYRLKIVYDKDISFDNLKPIREKINDVLKTIPSNFKYYDKHDSHCSTLIFRPPSFE